ncbi:MAG TPA: hypothetical protein VGZ25_14395, partial [Gemmataceae bacterium]|nr:hypothetical protein [Gemmataceae bacterium]
SVNPNQKQSVQASLEMVLAVCRGDEAGYLKTVADHADLTTFEAFLLKGKLTEAADSVDKELVKSSAYLGLVYLFAVKAGDKKLTEKYWQAMVDGLAKGDRDERRASAMAQDKQLFDADLMCRFAIRPDEKRVILAAFAQKYPDKKKPLLDLARKLDFQHDAVSLCLKKVLK